MIAQTHLKRAIPTNKNNNINSNSDYSQNLWHCGTHLEASQVTRQISGQHIKDDAQDR